MIDMPQVGNRIRIQRKKMKLTQKELARRIKVNPHYISDIENGRRHPSADTLDDLANALQMSLDYMFRGTSPIESCPASLLSLIETATPADLKRLELILSSFQEYNRSADETPQ